MILQLRKKLSAMKDRCYNPNNKAYKFYGAKGITVCDDWLSDSIAFQEWALEHGWYPGLTIDRIDPEKGYSPDNCRFVTHQENSKFKSNTLLIEVGIYCDSAAGWSKRIGKSDSWFSCVKHKYGFLYAYKKLVQHVKECGGVKKVMNVDEQSDISQFLADIENDCLEVDL